MANRIETAMNDTVNPAIAKWVAARPDVHYETRESVCAIMRLMFLAGAMTYAMEVETILEANAAEIGDGADEAMSALFDEAESVVYTDPAVLADLEASGRLQ